MINLIKMDLRRTFRTPLLYALLLGMGVMVGTFAMTGTMGENQSIAALIGPTTISNDMMSNIGMSMVLIFGAVYIVSIIGNDFSTGFIKNILTVHANKWDYILSKLVVSGLVSIVIIVFYVTLMMVLGMIQGLPLAISSFGGLLLFLIEKLLLAVALNALVMSFMLLTRNLAVSVIACFLFGMGGVTMLLSSLSVSFGIPLLQTISTLTIAGSSTLGTLSISISCFMHIVLCAIFWLVFSLGCSRFIMKKKDI